MKDRSAMRRVCAGTAGVILAGGRSRRMGRPKAFLKLGGRPLIAWVLEPLRDLFPEVLIVSPEIEPFSHLGVRVVPDHRPRGGPLGGAATGIAEAGRPQALVVGCDMPLLRPGLLAHLVARMGAHAAVVPRTSDGLHPLHAVYAKRALETFSRCLEEGVRKFTDALDGADCLEVGEGEIRRLDPDLHSLFNVNHPQDVERAREILEGGPAGAWTGPMGEGADES
jgi:molybdopterin-guanine dinucleotide biosynthesis protein A